MRNRSNSGVRLDYYQRIVHKTILAHQNPVTGLVPATPQISHSWVRDNVYSVLCVWGLAMAYKKNADLDEDRAKAYELEQSCVKLMRGLLMAMMMQKDKVEKFKDSLSVKDALHAKYNSTNCRTVVSDDEWGHLQIDATSLYLLILAQMTGSGLQIIFNLDEVCFIQNLVFYIESAYYIPDYGIWERGDKTNHGLPELNASSIGLAKAALEAMNELDLFGARGGPSSVIHVLADEAQKCEAVLQSMLPRESNSKELDAALLSVISFPAFAVADSDLIKYTRECIVEKLQGRYGCIRFLRDGHKTPKEDPSRLYYDPWELRMFENIECEWPLFFCYLILDASFQHDKEMATEYQEALDELLIKTDDGLKLVPELYAVAAENAESERRNPHTQDRIPLGRCPFMWAQSLYVLGKLLQEGFLSPGELDPLNRRLGSEKKPDVVVQIVILAQNVEIQEKLAQCDINVKTFAQVLPIEVQPSRVLSTIYSYLGQSKKLELTGRKSKDIGILTTSKLYSLQDRIFAFTPQFADIQRFYIASDIDLLIDIFKTEIAFLKSNWHMLGRPTVILPATAALLDEQGRIPAGMISTVKKLKSGYINGTRVNLGNLSDFLSTSCMTSLNFLNNHEDGYPDSLISEVQYALEKELQKVITVTRRKSGTQIPTGATALQRRKNRFSRRTSVAGMIRRSRSFKVHEDALAVAPSPAHSRRVSAISPVRQLPYEGIIGLATAFESPPESDRSTRSPSPGSHSEVLDDDWLPIIASRTASDQQYEQVDMEELVGTLRETDSMEEQGDILHFMALSQRVADQQYEQADMEELVKTLRETDNMEEQGDILHFLAVTHGLDFSAYVEDGVPVKVKDLLKDLYGKACNLRQWALVRHTAGMLGKRVEDLAKSVTDLLVRQKQVTIGIPPYNEKTITRPMSANELRMLIHQVYGTDESTAMLTQELIVYLAMFIRTEPQMFQEMLRLRVGLIIEVMASELARTLKCAGNDATEFLMNLSPFEMKNLLHHIISGKEFGVHSARSGTLSVVTNKSTKGRRSQVVAPDLTKDGLLDDRSEPDRYGQWIRRRKLDGALNRVPKNFYPNIWKLLERCNGFSVAGKVVPRALTEEMTAGELKFALQVETVLNAIPQPEYRQLVVEALSVLIVTVENGAVESLGNIVHVEDLVHKANQIFLEDQRKIDGDAMLCCADPTAHAETPCNGAAGICTHFFDSAPSGSYGTMTYLIRAVAHTLETLPASGEIECTLS